MSALILTAEEQAALASLDPVLDAIFASGATDGSNVLLPKLLGYDIAGQQSPNQQPTVRQSFELALIAMLRSVNKGYGFQGYDAQNNDATVLTGSFQDILPAWTVSVPFAKTYLLQAQVTAIPLTLSGGRSLINVRVVVNGTPLSFLIGQIDMSSLVNAWSNVFHLPVALNAGNNTIQLQASNQVATGSFSGNGSRIFTLIG